MSRLTFQIRIPETSSIISPHEPEEFVLKKEGAIIKTYNVVSFQHLEQYYSSWNFSSWRWRWRWRSSYSFCLFFFFVYYY